MCMVSEYKKERVVAVARSLMKRGESFTGYDVHKLVSRDSPHIIFDSKDVSAYVRQMFNRGDMAGYASTQVVPGSGPVLYFRIHPRQLVSKKIKEIRQSLDHHPINGFFRVSPEKNL